MLSGVLTPVWTLGGRVATFPPTHLSVSFTLFSSSARSSGFRCVCALPGIARLTEILFWHRGRRCRLGLLLVRGRETRAQRTRAGRGLAALKI
jgi:hypothetical protein